MNFPKLPHLTVPLDYEHRDIMMFLLQISNDKANLGRIASTLMEYALDHFKHEETLMYEISYPAKARDEHIRSHNSFTLSITKLLERGMDSEEAIEALRLALVNHLAVCDTLLSEWMKENVKVNPSTDNGGGGGG